MKLWSSASFDRMTSQTNQCCNTTDNLSSLPDSVPSQLTRTSSFIQTCFCNGDKNRYTRRQLAASLLIALVLGFLLLSLITLIVWSLTNRWPYPAIKPEGFTLRGWTALVSAGGSHHILHLALQSIALSAFVALISCLIALSTARACTLLAQRHPKNPLLPIIDVLGFLPLIIPSTVLALGMQAVFIALGLVSSLLGVIIIHTIVSVPYTLTIIIAASLQIQTRLEDQAVTLGASRFTAYISTTLCQLRPAIVASFVVSFIISYSQYITTLMVGAGQIQTISLVMLPYIQSGDRTLASCYALVFILTALALLTAADVLTARYYRKTHVYPSNHSDVMQPRTLHQQKARIISEALPPCNTHQINGSGCTYKISENTSSSHSSYE